ncbi:hypothetical protein GYMLUDRAFT_205684, partial [Collybiopsis luxurians FD-317 M1]
MSTPNTFSATENQSIHNLTATVHSDPTLGEPTGARECASVIQGIGASDAPRVEANQTLTGFFVHSSPTARRPIGIQEASPSGSNLQSIHSEEYSPTTKASVIPELVKNQVNSGPTASTHPSLLQPAQNNEDANQATQGAGSTCSNQTQQTQAKALDIQTERYSQAKVESPRNQTLNQSGQLNKESERVLGIPKFQSTYSGGRTFDYEEKYPQELEGQETSENARVWKVYLDEAESHNEDMLKSFRDTIDTLLVFATLFSAVVTSFIIQTSQALQPDYNHIQATLMVEQNLLLRAAGNITAMKSIQSPLVDLENGTPSTNDLWINGLFFASLSLSLVTALLSVLVKQWLLAYASLTGTGSAKQQAFTRHFRYMGMEKWKVHEIVGVLPLVLHLSLGLFSLGFVLFVFQLDRTLSFSVIIITSVSFLMYIISIFLPVIWVDCPYRIPLLFIPAQHTLQPFQMIPFLFVYLEYLWLLWKESGSSPASHFS